MSVNNRISKVKMSETQNEKVVEYTAGDELVKLTPNMIKQYLVRGDGNVTDQEVVMFLNLCRYQHLNPFLNEAYLIKFGNQPATIVTGKDAITKRAMRNQKYEGQQAGIVIYHEEKGELEYRTGSLLMKGEKLVGGWAKVFVKGYQLPIESSVSLDEYIGLKKDGSVNQQWERKPATMIRKVALVSCLREAFPEDLGGMYDQSEMGVEIDEEPIPQVEPTQAPQDVQTEIEFVDEEPDIKELETF